MRGCMPFTERTPIDMAATRLPLPDPGPLRPYIASFELALRADGKAAKTRETYIGAATRLAGWLLTDEAGVPDWAKVRRVHLRAYMAWLLDRYSPGYANNQYRAIQQFWRWYADEEDAPNPLAGMSPPDPGSKLVPVLDVDQLAALVRDAEAGRDFESRRDAALLRLFACSGARLAEIALLDVDDVDLAQRQALVTGKGNRQRWVKFDYRAARVLDRYLRVRASRPAAGLPALWLGVRRRCGMTPSGVYQVIARRGERLGIKLNPHMFRHTFSHRWLDAGGAEGDLMELNGWTSPQMLRRYGASARAARAARAYDRIDIMGGV